MAPVLEPAWSPFLRDPRRAAVLVDFDGSLAPIVDDPGRAAPVPAAVTACTRLARHLAVVGVVSGRPVEYLRRHLPDAAVLVVGQYGLEWEADGVVTTDPRALAYAPTVAAAAAEAERRWPGCRVERKGRVAVTIHWRTAPAAAPDPSALASLAAAHGLAALPGRMACELRPPLAVDKGTAVADVLTGRDLAAVAFAGDDHGDLAAFAALAAWAAAPGRSALRVAVASAESPPELLVAADLALDGPPMLATRLTALADALDTPDPPTAGAPGSVG